MYPVAVTGKLSTMEMAEFEEHRRECPECVNFTEADAYYRTRMQTVGFVPNVPPLPIAFQRDRSALRKERRSFLPGSLSLAAGMVLGVILVGSFLFRNGTVSPEGKNVVALTTDSVQHVVKTPQFATNDSNGLRSKQLDSMKAKHGTQPIPEQFTGPMQVVSGK
jgi:hypothetical protein